MKTLYQELLNQVVFCRPPIQKFGHLHFQGPSNGKQSLIFIGKGLGFIKTTGRVLLAILDCIIETIYCPFSSLGLSSPSEK